MARGREGSATLVSQESTQGAAPGTGRGERLSQSRCVGQQMGHTYLLESLEKEKERTPAVWPFNSKALVTSRKSPFLAKHTSHTFTSGVKPQDATNLGKRTSGDRGNLSESAGCGAAPQSGAGAEAAPLHGGVHATGLCGEKPSRLPHSNLRFTQLKKIVFPFP